MATATETPAEISVAAAPAVKVPMMTMLFCCVLTVVFAVGGAAGAMMFLAKSGKLGVGAAPVAVAKVEAPVVMHPKPLEPLLINLADAGGHAYLRLSLVLEEEEDPLAKPKEKEEAKPVPGSDAAIRDTVFDVLGRQTGDALLAPDGKEKLKVELLAAITARNPELHVKTIYFTDFLVQR